MRSRWVSRAAVVLAMLGAATLVGNAAAADPPVPEAADPAAGAVSPVVDEVPACGNLSVGLVAVDLAVQAVSAAVGPALPAAVTERAFDAYGQAFLTLFRVDSAVCETLPDRQFTTTCDADDQVASTIARVPFPGLPVEVGVIPIPTEPALVGALVDVIAAVEREAAAAGNPSATVGTPLGCETVERVAAAPAPPGLSGDDVDLSLPGPQATPADKDLVVKPGEAPLTKTRASRSAPQASTAEVPTQVLAGQENAPGAPEAAAAVPAVAGRRDDSTRRNVYFVLFLLTAGAAIIGWAPPRRRPDAN